MGFRPSYMMCQLLFKLRKVDDVMLMFDTCYDYHKMICTTVFGDMCLFICLIMMNNDNYVRMLFF